MSLDRGPCFDADKVLSNSSAFKLFSQAWKKTLYQGNKDV